MTYVVQAGIGDELYYRMTVFADSEAAARLRALREMRQIKSGIRLPNEEVSNRSGCWREDRLFHPTWARIVHNNREEITLGRCPAALDLPIVRPLPRATSLATTLAALGNKPGDDLTRRKLRSKARRDIQAAREELARCLAVYKSLK